MTQLFICEKPSQARDIARVLGATQRKNGLLYNNQVLVTWCFGHMLEMVQPQDYDEQYRRWNLESLPIVPTEWKLQTRKSAAAQLKIIKSSLKACREVVIATDADREGEVIARELLDLYHYTGPVRRLWLSALDDATIKRALQNLLPGQHTVPLYHAGVSRARADWLVGMNLTRAYTVLGRQIGLDTVLSVGRVQTPALRMIVDRDIAIENFVPTAYWDIAVILKGLDAKTFQAQWVGPVDPKTGKSKDKSFRCLSESIAQRVADKVVHQSARIVEIEVNHNVVNQPLGYDLATLQSDASKKYGFSANQTLQLVQALYEKHKVASYPRTNCPYLPESQRCDAPILLATLATNDPTLKEWITQADPSIISKTWNQKKVDAASHHGIIPIDNALDVSVLNDEEKKIYRLICLRYIAQFYPCYEYQSTTVDLSCCDEAFVAKGKRVLVAGWKAIYADESDSGDERELPPLNEGDEVKVENAKVCRKETKPPPHYTEGTFIVAMKKAGLGQEATRAGIIETLKERDYIKTSIKKMLVSSEKGRVLIQLVPDAVKDPQTTALWEQALENIAQDKIPMKAFIEQQTQWINTIVGKLKRNGLGTE